MRLAKLPIELTTALYVLTYIPYMVITRMLTTMPQPGVGRPLTGLEVLPPVMIIGTALTLLFVIWAGWTKSANQLRIAGTSVPWPRWSTFISGIGTAMLLFTVPMSLTFENVSIPFMQLIMRGDVLIIAPLVDLIARRRVRWWSWVALALVAIGMYLTISERRGLNLPPLAIFTIIVYTIGYFVRLSVMTRIAKSGKPNELEAYFVEEKIVAMPLSVLMLAAVALTPWAQGSEFRWGFVDSWTSSAFPQLALLSLSFVAVSIFAALILLDPRENTFCVPFERAASIASGILAAFLMAIVFGQKYPTQAEIVGTSLLIVAIALLSVAPRIFGDGKKKAAAEEAALT